MSRFRALIPLLLLSACATDDAGDRRDDCFVCAGKTDSAPSSLPPVCVVDELLTFVSTADFDELDLDVGLDSRAAAGIADHGGFDSLAELDAVPYVGPVALETLLAYVGDTCVPLDITQGEPNTGFMETFLNLQEAADGPCVPFGSSYFYDAGATPSDRVAARAIAAQLGGPSAAESAVIETGLSPSLDLEPFLASFGFSVSGLETEIGPGDYEIAGVFTTTATDALDVMVLHYPDSDDLWAITLACTLD